VNHEHEKNMTENKPHNSPESRPMSRRECIAWLTGTFVAAACARPGESHAADGGAKVANLIELRNECARLLEHPEAILSRTNKGVACFSAICTHRRNKLEVDKDGAITCPVHDSIFDLSGQPIGGPATRPLTWFATQVSEDGDISVDPSQTVPLGTWAKLPDWATRKK
jgi:Rieske Fe-S protein